jgi:membrane-associated phospholipid phosphatase
MSRFARLVPGWLDAEVLRVVRWTAVSAWGTSLVLYAHWNGIPYARTDLLFWIALGLLAWSIGNRAPWKVAVDLVPFAVVLIVYDHLRGIADTLGMPTWWHPQLDVDKALFGGRVPTVVLQEHFKHIPQARWWDVVAAVTYFSFFFLPYVTAGVLWLRGRRDFRRWAARFVSLSLLGFAFFALIPAAPPWAAARCTAAQVSSHPSAPLCMFRGAGAHNGLLGAFTETQPGSAPYVERFSTFGLTRLHLHFASAMIKTGQASSDLVAAVPSLHAGGIMLFTIFFWRRANRFWKGVLVAYNPLMAFALVYTGEHYVSDILAGWLLAWGVSALWDRIERIEWRRARAPVDTLEAPPPSEGARPCPPTVTTPSSTSASDAASSTRPVRSMAAPGQPGTTAPSASS